MPVEAVVRVTCDRCPRVIEEKAENATELVEKKDLILYCEHESLPEVRFKYLCPKCKDRVEALYQQILLAKPEENGNEAPPKKKGRKKKVVEKKPAEVQEEPEAEEGDESEEDSEFEEEI